MALLVCVRLLSAYLLAYAQRMVPEYFGLAAGLDALSAAQGARFLSGTASRCLLLSLPVLLTAALAGFLLGGAQTGFLFTPSLLKPKLSRINPVAGVKRLFAARSLVELFKAFLKVALIGAALYTELKTRIPGAAGLANMDTLGALIWLADALYSILLKVCVILLALGAFDLLYQWWDHGRQLRMTRQEIKDEFKNTEGDPAVRGRIRQLQNRMCAARMIKRVPEADAVVRNPTHYAVAIRYDQKKNKAPAVVAKGADFVALKIIEVAQKSGVPVLEDRPLARGLYESVDVDREIPEQFYKAVAEVLAFVYNLKKGGKRI